MLNWLRSSDLYQSYYTVNKALQILKIWRGSTRSPWFASIDGIKLEIVFDSFYDAKYSVMKFANKHNMG